MKGRCSGSGSSVPSGWSIAGTQKGGRCFASDDRLRGETGPAR